MTAIHSRKLFFMLAVSLGLTSAYALETEQFVYSVVDGEARVTGLSNAGKDAEMLSIPEAINGNPVTRISGDALRGAKCYGITIPNSVRYIGGYAFYSCPNLIYLEIPPSVTNDIPNALVYDCPKLGEVAFCLTNATSAVKIGNNCLKEVSALTNVVVRGNGAMTLGDSAFYNLASIQAATLQGVVEIEGGSAWNTGAFNGCANLEQVTLIDSPLRNIGARAFRDCAALASFAIPNTVTNIGSYAFRGCAALQSATLPEGLLSMGLQCFANCTSLGEATLPDSLCGDTGNYAYSEGYFAGCTSMTNLVIGSGIPVVKKFYLPFDSTNAFTVTVNGSGATVIDCNAFKGTKAGSVVLNGVASIEGTSASGDGAFSGCSSLTSIVLGAGLVEIGGRAFCNCSALGELVLPESVETIGNNSFQSTASLTNIVFQGETAPTLGDWAFDGTSAGLVLTVPFDGTGYGVENGATGNWAKIAAEKVRYTDGAESGYGAWAVSAGIAGRGTAAKMGGYGLDDKVANAFIYAFGDAATNAPLMRISFNENGKPVITTPPLVRTEGFTFLVVASDNVDGTGNVMTTPLSASGETTINETGKTKRFFRLRATEGDAEPDLGGVQLWANGPYWAECNVGASAPEESGYYFWWGDTVGYKRENDAWVASDGSTSNFSFEEGNTPTFGKDNDTLLSEGWITADGVLAPEHDAAQAHWGGSWRMPTGQELSDLKANCTFEWINTNGVFGLLVTGKGDYANRGIFLPRFYLGDTGIGLNLGDSSNLKHFFWLSTPHSNNSNYAQYLMFYSGNVYLASQDRYLGQPVRPVRDAD